MKIIKFHLLRIGCKNLGGFEYIGVCEKLGTWPSRLAIDHFFYAVWK